MAWKTGEFGSHGVELFALQGKTTTLRSGGIVEGTEFIKRFVEGKGDLPLLTSCCPAWTDWMEKYAPDFTENFSTAKSPQQMLSALAKSYWAEKAGVDPKSIYMVSIMPCTAKKYEIGRDEYMAASGVQDTDKVLTTRELARMIQSAGIEFNDLPEEPADELLGEYTGAGTIFGVTGGVMEAALRTAYCLITGEAQPPSIDFQMVRGMQGGRQGIHYRNQGHPRAHRRCPRDGQREDRL